MNTRKNLIDSFVIGATSGVGGSAHTGTASLSINGNELFSYSTVIARRLAPKRMWISSEYYSKTTSTQQNLLRVACARMGVAVES